MDKTRIQILLIEDSAPDADYLQEMLSTATNPVFSILHAGRLAEGLEMLASGNPDAVLLDLGLPDSQGMNTLVSVRHQAPKLPVIVMTGLADEDFAVSAIKTGADDYLMKGQISEVLLIRTIRYTMERKRADEALRESEERYRAVMEAAQDAIFNVDEESRIILVNQAAERIFGYTLDQMYGQPLTMLMPERLRQAHQQAIRKHTAQGKRLAWDSVEVPGLRKDGREVPLEISYGEFTKEGRRYFIGIVRDITERKRDQEALLRSNAVLKQAGQIANLGAWEIDIVHPDDMYANPLLWSDQVYRIFGYEPGEVEVTKPFFFERVHPDDRQKVADAFEKAVTQKKPYDIEHRIVLPDGTERIVIEKAEVTFDGQGTPLRVVGIVQDVTERKKAEETIRYQAFHDLLTGLPNRDQLMVRLRLELVQHEKNRKRLAVLHVDLDRFRTINDTLGHATGDKVIKAVTRRLATMTRKNDTLSRIGSDEFVILRADLDRVEDAALFAQKLVDAMRKPLRVNRHELYTTVSVGISVYPEDGNNAEIMIKNADIAVSAVKDWGRNNFQFFNPALNRRTVERLLLESNLRQSLERGELQVYYQPQISIATGKMIAMEALSRWNHPDLGLLEPSQFIPVAEEIGFIGAIDEWVLRTATAQNRSWLDAGLPALCMTVNISAQQFQHPAFVGTVRRILGETGLDARYLDIEITESTAMRDIDRSVPNLNGLHDLGVDLSIDDFGTGYSSLNYLKRFPVHKLKIDQSFIRGIAEDKDDQAIVKAVIAMGHTLGLKVIAEGVETKEQLSFLKSSSCDEGQGFLFSEPLPAEGMKKLLVA
jgi:diguanylate cyclase (GGDEF)-like protein/PAS domain S-box-containing protein